MTDDTQQTLEACKKSFNTPDKGPTRLCALHLRKGQKVAPKAQGILYRGHKSERVSVQITLTVCVQWAKIFHLNPTTETNPVTHD